MVKGNKNSGGSSGGSTGGGFISFSSVTSENSGSTYNKTTGDSSSNLSLISPVYTGGDNNLSVASKKILKKDTTTKVISLSFDYIYISDLNLLLLILLLHS